MFSLLCPIPSAPAHDRGMSTAEYAMGTIAAVALAGVLYFVVTSEPVSSALTSIVVDALQPRH